MAHPRISTVVAAGVASAVAFTIITRSGLAGTLVGAAVFSMVITGANHGLLHVFDRFATRWQRWRGLRAHPGSDVLPDNRVRSEEVAVAAQSSMAPPGRDRPLWQRRVVLAVPYALAVIALGVSAYTLVGGTPSERVIVRERVVQQPGTTVVKVVTVTVPAMVPAAAPRTTATLPGGVVITTTTAPQTTTTSLAAGATTTTGPPPTSATTQPATPATSAAPTVP